MLQCVKWTICTHQSVVYIKCKRNAVSQRVCDKKKRQQCATSFYYVRFLQQSNLEVYY